MLGCWQFRDFLFVIFENAFVSFIIRQKSYTLVSFMNKIAYGIRDSVHREWIRHFYVVIFLTKNLKRIVVVSLAGNVPHTGLYVIVIVILVVSFIVHIVFFVAESVFPAVVFAVLSFESILISVHPFSLNSDEYFNYNW